MEGIAHFPVPHGNAGALQFGEDWPVARLRRVSARLDDHAHRHPRLEPCDDGVGDERVGHFLHADIETDHFAVDIREQTGSAVGEASLAVFVGCGRRGTHGEDSDGARGEYHRQLELGHAVRLSTTRADCRVGLMLSRAQRGPRPRQNVPR